MQIDEFNRQQIDNGAVGEKSKIAAQPQLPTAQPTTPAQVAAERPAEVVKAESQQGIAA